MSGKSMILIGVMVVLMIVGIGGVYLWKYDSCNFEVANMDGKQSKNIEDFNSFVETSSVCNIGALSTEQRKKHSESTVRLFSAVKNLREEDNGYSFELPSDSQTLQKISEWIDLERKCCPFMEFKLTVGDETKPLILQIGGDGNAKEFLKNSPLVQLKNS